MVNFRRFQQGDQVSYCGSRFSKDLSCSLGVVVGIVRGTDHSVVVDFGSDSYILDERYHLMPFNGKVRGDASKEDKRGVDVQKKRGGKRRDKNQESSDE